MRQNVSIVVYHDISAEKNPLTAHLSISTRPELFRKHIAYFVKNFDLIDADELLSGRLPRRPLLLTFDDAYRSVLSQPARFSKRSTHHRYSSSSPQPFTATSLPIDNVLSLAVEEMGFPGVLGLMSLTRGRTSHRSAR